MFDFQEVKEFYGLLEVVKLPEHDCVCIYKDKVFYEVNKNAEALVIHKCAGGAEHYTYENAFRYLTSDVLKDNSIAVIKYRHENTEVDIFNACFSERGWDCFLISEDFFSKYIDANTKGINFGYSPWLLMHCYWVRPDNKFRKSFLSKDINVLFNVMFYCFHKDFNNRPKRRYIKTPDIFHLGGLKFEQFN